MDRFARTVLGYHGCKPEFAEALLRGDVSVDRWKPSENEWDWLGHGIYFWEYAPERAKSWMSKGGVVGAIIQLGNCLDLTDIKATQLLAQQFEVVRQIYQSEGKILPGNRGKRADLDCLVINELMSSAAANGTGFDTIRCPFLEGKPAFAGSAILAESHIQLAVRNPANILGIFRPGF